MSTTTKIKTILKWYLPGALLGMLGGYIYWYNWGCDGTCLITSSPYRSMIYFGVMGILLNQMFKPNSTSSDLLHQSEERD